MHLVPVAGREADSQAGRVTFPWGAEIPLRLRKRDTARAFIGLEWPRVELPDELRGVCPDNRGLPIWALKLEKRRKGRKEEEEEVN